MLEQHSAQLAAFLLTVPLVAGALVGGPGLMSDSTPQLSLQPVAATKIDTSDRAAVRAALVKRLRPAVLEPIGWNGSTFPCVPDAPSAASQKATLTAVNFFRALAQLDPVTFDPAMSARAQQAALMMTANQSLSHNPPSTWPCWTQDGATAAGQSNLCLGCTGAGAIVAYLRDDGDGNEAVGHRRWVLYPPTTVMGIGSTTSANALTVFGENAKESTNRPQWVSWPTPGYFPTEFEPSGRWSLSASDPLTDFSAAKVGVRTGDGTALTVKALPVANGYGSNTLVWKVNGLKVPTGTTARRFDVTVTGIRLGDSTVSRKYTVRLFAAEARLKATVLPKLKGTAKVGRTLQVTTGTWSPAAKTFGYTWYRSGAKIAGATTSRYTLTSADAGRTVLARVKAYRGGYNNGLYRTPARRIAP